MICYFKVQFSSEAELFLDNLNAITRKKVLYNIDRAKYKLDTALIKKLTDEIWEFRTRYGGLNIRLFAFWDTENNKCPSVIVTHGILKKTRKIPVKEIKKAMKIREIYFEIGVNK